MTLAPPSSQMSRDLSTAAALLLLAVAAAVDLAIVVLSLHRMESGQPLTEAADVTLGVVAGAVYAVVVLAVARTPQRQALACGLAVAALVLNVLFWYLLTHGPLQPTSYDEARSIFQVRWIIDGLLLVGAWSVSRRSGHRWWPGLLVVPVLVLAQAPFEDDLVRSTANLGTALRAASLWAWASAVLPIAGVACWLLDGRSTSKMTPARHPRG
ncbi:hypothetical protein ABFU82_13870 [Nocardioides sp. WV_118_6]